MEDEMIEIGKIDEEDRLYYESLGGGELKARRSSVLPRMVEDCVASASEVSKNNEVPAALIYYGIIGQLCKDMVKIPRRRGTEDTRPHIVWLQTSGSGKSEMMNFYIPVSNYVFRELNEKYGTNFTVFDVKEVTDAALIGSVNMVDEVVEDEDGGTRTIRVPEQIHGGLEGEGLLVYDEFENSGVFKPTQHNQRVILYLNTLMNSLHGHNWVITKQLREGGVLECRCSRSMIGMSYIPKILDKMIADTGIFQRCLMYIREVPIGEQNEMRSGLAYDYGIRENHELPIVKYGNEFIKVYDALKKRFDEVDGEAYDTVKFGKGFNDALYNETWKFQHYVQRTRPAIMAIANNFITRMQTTMVRLAVLSCIVESTTMRNKDARYVVTEKHIRQASNLVRQCYKSLVVWLDQSLKQSRSEIKERVNAEVFIKGYQAAVKKGLGDKKDFVHKTRLLKEVELLTKKSEQTVYRWFNEDIAEMFEQQKIGVSYYLKLKPEFNKKKETKT